MGWIRELQDVAAKSKRMRILIVATIVIIFLAFGSITFFVLKAAFEGRPVKAAGVELPQARPDHKPPDSVSSFSPKR